MAISKVPQEKALPGTPHHETPADFWPAPPACSDKYSAEIGAELRIFFVLKTKEVPSNWAGGGFKWHVTCPACQSKLWATISLAWERNPSGTSGKWYFAFLTSQCPTCQTMWSGRLP